MITTIEKESDAISYDEALSKSVEYFDGEVLPATVFLDKYALRDNDQNLLESTPRDMHHRLTREFHRIEQQKYGNSKNMQPLSYEAIFNYLDNFSKIIPQGSPMYGIGNPFQFISLSNCFVSETPLDAYSSICHTDQQFVQLCKRRGGVGTDLSNLRPAGTPTRNGARTSTGILPFLRRFSNSIREVAQNGRRGASMQTLSIHHPESVILLPEGQEPTPVIVKNENMADIATTTQWYNPEVKDFASIKYDLSDITGSNISLRLTDEFLSAVEKGEKYQQRWPVDSEHPVITQWVDARQVWDKIIRSAWQIAEPGLLFWDNILRESPADCYADVGFRTVSTNPCSEIALSECDSCRLLLLNLYSYVTHAFEPNAYFDFKTFYEDAQVAQRLMDDLVDLEVECIDRILEKIKSDPEPDYIKASEVDLWQKIRAACVNGRRTGTGITALGDTLAALGVKYGSPESIDITNNIYRTLKLGAYRASVDMAKELGPFPVWDAEKEKDNAFLLRIAEEDPELAADMRKYGRRNIALLTTAPAGTVSIETQTTSGIEPVFRLSHTRRKKGNPGDKNFRADFVDQNGDAYQEFVIYHKRFYDWFEKNMDQVAAAIPGIESAAEIDLDKPEHRSIAENLSPWAGCCAGDLDWKQRVRLQAAAQRHVDHAISSTINLPNDVEVDKVAEIYMEAWHSGLKGITVYRDKCRTGILIETEDKKEEKKTRIPKTVAPARPRELECDVHHIRVKGDPYFVLVGLMDGDPYEVFAGSNSQPEFDKTVKKGTIVREKRGKYVLMDGDRVILDSITSHQSAEHEMSTRLTSTALRHGADINFIVHQLEKVHDDMQSFCKAKARALKKYIPDGTKVTGEICPSCSSGELVRAEGCVQCSNCAWTKCS